MTSKNIKKRYWAFVLYTESAPTNWKELLQETALPIAISPYHDKDVNPDNTPKKAHYHIILCWNNPTTYENVKRITDSLNQPRPIPLECVKGYYDYFIHKDNPEKYQYNPNDITTLNGFSPSDYFELSQAQVISFLSFLTKFIDDNDITEYSTLIAVVRDSDDLYQYLDVAMNKTIFLNTYITSRRHGKKVS